MLKVKSCFPELLNRSSDAGINCCTFPSRLTIQSTIVIAASGHIASASRASPSFLEGTWISLPLMST